MDRVATLLGEISRLPEMAFLDRRFGGFLNDVAEIYERHGLGVAKAYLLNQQARRRAEATLLLKVLEKLDGCPEVRTNRGIGRQIIKCLFDLKGGTRP